MARARTVSAIAEEAIDAADMDDSVSASGTFVTLSTVYRRVAQSYATLRDMLVQANGPAYFRTSVSATTVAGTPTVALATSIYKVLGVDYSLGGKTHEALPMEWSRRNLYQERSWSNAGSVYYDIEGSNLRFWPTPDAAYALTIWNISAPVAATAATAASTLDGIAGWEEFIVFDVATWLRIKEESDPSAMMAERERIAQRIRTMAPRRDRGQAERPRDTRSRWSLRRRNEWNDP